MPEHTARATAARDAGAWYDPLVRGVLRRCSPAGADGRLSTLIFHRVHEKPDPLFPGEVDRARFDALCGWVAQWFNVLPLEEAVERLQRRSLPERAMAITFDDGYRDNHDLAMPILKAHGLPATFFIATGFIDGGRMWNDTVIEAVRRSPLEELRVQGLGLDLGPGVGDAPLPLRGLEARRAAIHRLLPAIKYRPPAERLELVAAVAERAGSPPLPDDLMMRRDEVQAMARNGLQIGAHTVNHPILAGLPDAQALREMRDSRAWLEDLLRQPVRTFAYPNGRPGSDYRPRDVALAREAGFSVAVTTAPGAALPGDDPHRLPRFVPWDRTRARWAARLVQNLKAAPVDR